MDISLYFHIPFCTKKCPYCHFYVLVNRSPLHDTLTKRFDEEWTLFLPELEGKRIVSIYFGGGTPTLYGPEAIGKLIERARPWLSEDCEITLEANPEGSDRELFSKFHAIGINRLSLGVQSFDDALLKTLGRTHSAKRAEEAIHSANAAGFTNISIDLMTEIPGQTEESMQRTLDTLPYLPLSHVSLYNLTFETGTAFARREKELKPFVPDGACSLKLLEMTIEALEARHLPRYEISAFGRPSRHNLGYWTGRPFLGFGPSAFSYWKGERFRNGPLHQGGVDFRETLPYPANVRERLAIQLRLLDGVDLATLGHPIPNETSHILLSLKEKGFVKEVGSKWQLTKQGLLFYDSIASELI